MRHQLISLSTPEKWRIALQDLPHAFGHTWESCYAMHLSTKLPTFLYVLETDEARVVCPIAERAFNGSLDVVTPYGFSGFTGSGSIPNFQEHWQQFAKDRGYVCGYIGLNSILPMADFVISEKKYINQALYYLNLKLTPEQLLAGMSARRREHLKQYALVAEHINSNKQASTGFFMANVHDFLNARGASAVYRFTPQTLEMLLNLNNVFIAAYAPGGEVQAVSVFAYTPYTAEYLFNVSIPSGKSYAAHLIWYAVQQLQQIKVPFLNLGGGIQEGDGVAEFKRRFGAERYPLVCLKQIYNMEKYCALCYQAGVEPTVDGYFPAYRKSNS